MVELVGFEPTVIPSCKDGGIDHSHHSSMLLLARETELESVTCGIKTRCSTN